MDQKSEAAKQPIRASGKKDPRENCPWKCMPDNPFCLCSKPEQPDTLVERLEALKGTYKGGTGDKYDIGLMDAIAIVKSYQPCGDVVIHLGNGGDSTGILDKPKKTMSFATPYDPNRHCDAMRIISWIDDPKRKSAHTAFTEGLERQIAYRFEDHQDKKLGLPDHMSNTLDMVSPDADDVERVSRVIIEAGYNPVTAQSVAQITVSAMQAKHADAGFEGCLLDVIAEKQANGWDYGTHPREKAAIVLDAVRGVADISPKVQP